MILTYAVPDIWNWNINQANEQFINLKILSKRNRFIVKLSINELMPKTYEETELAYIN